MKTTHRNALIVLAVVILQIVILSLVGLLVASVGYGLMRMDDLFSDGKQEFYDVAAVGDGKHLYYIQDNSDEDNSALDLFYASYDFEEDKHISKGYSDVELSASREYLLLDNEDNSSLTIKKAPSFKTTTKIDSDGYYGWLGECDSVWLCEPRLESNWDTDLGKWVDKEWTDIFIIDAQTGKKRQITGVPGNAYVEDSSKDGSVLYFSSTIEDTDSCDIWRFDEKASELKKILHIADGSPEAFFLSESNEKIYYVTIDYSIPQLRVCSMNPNGLHNQVLWSYKAKSIDDKPKVLDAYDMELHSRRNVFAFAFDEYVDSEALEESSDECDDEENYFQFELNLTSGKAKEIVKDRFPKLDFYQFIEGSETYLFYDPEKNCFTERKP